MNPTLKLTVSSLQLRDELETMVPKELLGPGFDETLNHERYVEEVKIELYEKMKPKATKGKKEAKANTQARPSLFHEEEDA